MKATPLTRRGAGWISGAAALGLVSGCAPPTDTFVIPNSCDESVWVKISQSGEGAKGFTELAPADVATLKVPKDQWQLVLDVVVVRADGSSDLSYVEFDKREIQPDADGIYHLAVGPDCEAVQP